MEDRLEGKEKLFNKIEVDTILKDCAHIIRLGPICKTRIDRSLMRSSVGKHIMLKYDITQVQTRLKYERLKYYKKERRKKKGN